MRPDIEGTCCGWIIRKRPYCKFRLHNHGIWAIEHPDHLSVSVSDTGWHIPSYLTLLLGDTQSGHRVRTQEAKQRRAARKRQRRYEPAAHAVEPRDEADPAPVDTPAPCPQQADMQTAAHAEVNAPEADEAVPGPEVNVTWQWTRREWRPWQWQWWNNWADWTPHRRNTDAARWEWQAQDTEAGTWHHNRRPRDVAWWQQRDQEWHQQWYAYMWRVCMHLQRCKSNHWTGSDKFAEIAGTPVHDVRSSSAPSFFNKCPDFDSDLDRCRPSSARRNSMKQLE